MRVKKEPSGRRSVQVEVEVPGSAQSAVERRSAEAELRTLLAIRASANGVKLYFNRGKELPDPAKLLQGSGNQTRSINVESASTLARPEVARLIDEAIARNRAPFARAGRGSMVIRSTSAKQRRQRRPP